MADRAVFLDRDNTVIADPGYLTDPSGVQLLPGVAGALKSLAEAGYKLVLVTNQSGIARGMLTEAALEEIHDELQRQLAERGGRLDAIYTCPYHPDGTVAEYARESDERKPAPGMLLRAAEDLGLDLADSWMVGDRSRDIVAGRKAGCRTVRVLTGSHEPDDEPVEADFTSANLVEATRVILSGGTRGGRLKAPSTPKRESAPAPPSAPRPEQAGPEDEPVRPTPPMTDNEILAELFRLARQNAPTRWDSEFSVSKLVAGICQGVALLALALGLVRFLTTSSALVDDDAFWTAMGWFAAAGVLQLMTLTFHVIARRD